MSQVKLSHLARPVFVTAVLVNLGFVTLHAAPLNPGTTIPAPNEPGQPSAGATLLASSTVNFVAPFSFTGTLTSEVWNNDASSPFGPASLTFTYQFNIDASSGNAVDRFTISSFSGYLTDASYSLGSSGSVVPQLLPSVVAPLSVGRAPAGDIVRWVFEDGFGNATLAPGDSSALLVVQTSATAWQNTIGGVSDGSTANVSSFAPAVIPEPGTVFVTGLAGGVLFVLRRSRFV